MHYGALVALPLTSPTITIPVEAVGVVVPDPDVLTGQQVTAVLVDSISVAGIGVKGRRSWNAATRWARWLVIDEER